MLAKNPAFEALMSRDRIGRFKKKLDELGLPATDSPDSFLRSNEKLLAISDEAVSLASEGDFDHAQDYLDHFGTEDDYDYQVALNSYFKSCLRHFHMDNLPRNAVSQLFQACERQSSCEVMRTRDFYQTVREYANFYHALNGND